MKDITKYLKKYNLTSYDILKAFYLTAHSEKDFYVHSIVFGKFKSIDFLEIIRDYAICEKTFENIYRSNVSLRLLCEKYWGNYFGKESFDTLKSFKFKESEINSESFILHNLEYGRIETIKKFKLSNLQFQKEYSLYKNDILTIKKKLENEIFQLIIKDYSFEKITKMVIFKNAKNILPRSKYTLQIDEIIKCIKNKKSNEEICKIIGFGNTESLAFFIKNSLLNEVSKYYSDTNKLQ